MKIEKLNLQTLRGLTSTVLVCWLLSVLASDTLTVWFASAEASQGTGEILPLLRWHSFVISSLVPVPLFLLFLFHIRDVEEKRDTLQENIRRDNLTGLLTREAFLADIRAELAQVSNKHKLEDAFLIVDADFFKLINDTHGHIAGDRALIAITNALKKGIRGTDRIGRLGGEEFAIQLKGVSAERALEIAERLRQNVTEASHEADIPDLKLTVSIGAVAYTTKRDVVDLLIGADKLLYKAKENGRDRVEFARFDCLAAAL